MFKNGQRIVPKNETIRAANVTPVQTADKLLSAHRYTELLSNIRGLVTLPVSDYQRYYLSAIHRFAEFVQQLPETSASYYCHPYGLLDHGLARGYLALAQCRSYYTNQNKTIEEFSAEQSLWCYAVFTAGLLADLGKLAYQHEVTLCDRDGTALERWNPFQSSMVSLGKYYKYNFAEKIDAYLPKKLTPLLAYQILNNLPEEGSNTVAGSYINGFAWLASDQNVLETWLDILNFDQTAGGKILTYIPLAQAALLADYFNGEKLNLELLLKKVVNQRELAKTNQDLANTAKQNRDWLEREDQLTGTPAEAALAFGVDWNRPATTTPESAATNTVAGSVAQTVAPQLREGVAFLKWLQLRTSTGQIKINQPQAGVYGVNEGVMLTDKVFQDYANETPEAQNWRIVREQFERLELSVPQEYVNPTNQAVLSGLVVGNYFVVGFKQNPAVAAHFIKLPPPPPTPPMNYPARIPKPTLKQ